MSINVAILDDEELVREGIKYKFSFPEYGFKIVYEGDDGNHLLEKLKSLETIPDLILVDMMMPKISGIDFIRKAREINKSLQFVVISGFDDFEFVKEALKLEVSDYLLKPIDPDELKKVLLNEHQKITQLRKVSKENIHNEISRYLSKKEKVINLSEVARGYLENFLGEDSALHIVLLGNLYSMQNFSEIRKKLEECLPENQLMIWINGIPQFLVCITNESCTNNFANLIDYPTVTILTFKGIQNIEAISYLFKKSIPVIPYYLTLGKKTLHSFELKENKFNFDLLNKCLTEDTNNQDLINLISYDDMNTSLNALKLLLAQDISQKKKEYAFQLFVWKNYQSEVVLEWLQSFDSPQLFNEQCLHFLDLLNKEKQPLSGKEILDQLIEDLYQEYSLKRTLKDYADRYHIHPNYLARLFKQEKGVTFIDILTKIRIEKAEELLHNTTLKINEVALLVGYDDVRYFGQVFRKFFKTTPTQYRQSIEQEELKMLETSL